ncbi:hypothetical protein BG004_004296 [Podila humilis]|nr:hypothetical protein BG004_004296 [Podila humilis]
MSRYSLWYLLGKTHPQQPYGIGMNVAMLTPAEEYLDVHQGREFLRFGIWLMDIEGGTTDPEKKAEIGKDVEGPNKDWRAHWVPFQHSSNALKNLDIKDAALSTKERQQVEREAASARRQLVQESVIGQGCDIIVFYTHGGGFISGNSKMYLDIFRRWMANVYKHHGIRIGFLSVEYTLSPESRFPGAINECVAAYLDIVRKYSVDPKRIMFAGDSAGGNLSVTVSLKIRDEYPDLALPAGLIPISPYVGCDEPFETNLNDYLSPLGSESFLKCYTGDKPEVYASPYFSPMNATTLKGLPPMLVFVGSIEHLRPSIDMLVDKARADGVEGVEYVIGEGRSHVYIMVPQISLEEDIDRAHWIIGKFIKQNCNVAY